MKWPVPATFSLALDALSAPPPWADVSERYYGDHMMGTWGGMFLGPLMMVLTIAVIAVIVVLAVRWLGGGPQAGPQPPAAKSPLDILKERFARGEIDSEEYESRRRILE